MIVCHGCGEGLRVPKGHDGRYIRCPECGVVCETPTDAPAYAVKAAPPTGITVPRRQKPDDEDDDSPYEVPINPDEKVPCPKCRGKLAQDAIICAHCGYHLETGETFERLYKTVNLQWETGLPLRIRLGIFLPAGAVALMATVIVGAATGEWFTMGFSLLVGMTLQAYALGTYSRVNLTRSRKGRVRLTRTWRALFIPLPTSEINWREYEGVTARQSGETDFWDLIIFLFLLPWGLIPAVIFWLFMIHPGQFDAALTSGHGYPAVILYRGPSQSAAQEIVAKIREYTKLP